MSDETYVEKRGKDYAENFTLTCKCCRCNKVVPCEQMIHTIEKEGEWMLICNDCYEKQGKTGIEQRKRELVAVIQMADQMKYSGDFNRNDRLKAEDYSFNAYEELLGLCDGDTDLVARLLGQSRWHNQNKKR